MTDVIDIVPRTLSRRAFLKTMLASAASTTLLEVGGYAYGHNIESAWLDVNQVSLTLPNLSPGFDGYRLLQISDIHMDGWMTRNRLSKIVERVNKQQPDTVVITGDFVTGGNPDDFVGNLVDALSGLKPRHVVAAVLGNHDHWTDHSAIREVIRASGIVDVNNGVFTLEQGGALLHIAGVDDIWENQQRLDLVLEELPDEGAAILLAHEPDYADTSAQANRFDLQLSGHSHGGQVILPLLGPPVLPYLGERYPLGRYQVGDMIVYTNRGLGMVAPQVRINCRPEITVFTLQAPGA